MRELDGIITFHNAHHAVRAERLLQVKGIPNRTVPCPRDLSSSCGVALRFPAGEAQQVTDLLAHAGVQVESIRTYPEAQAVPSGWNALLLRRRHADNGKG
ncbi:MAG TPA: DUF3343 domain-containing protein [Symbiobacteriaceae bacterium]|jgi:hypothetical protein